MHSALFAHQLSRLITDLPDGCTCAGLYLKVLGTNADYCGNHTRRPLLLAMSRFGRSSEPALSWQRIGATRQVSEYHLAKHSNTERQTSLSMGDQIAPSVKRTSVVFNKATSRRSRGLTELAALGATRGPLRNQYRISTALISPLSKEASYIEVTPLPPWANLSRWSWPSTVPGTNTSLPRRTFWPPQRVEGFDLAKPIG